MAGKRQTPFKLNARATEFVPRYAAQANETANGTYYLPSLSQFSTYPFTQQAAPVSSVPRVLPSLHPIIVNGTNHDLASLKVKAEMAKKIAEAKKAAEAEAANEDKEAGKAEEVAAVNEAGKAEEAAAVNETEEH